MSNTDLQLLKKAYDKVLLKEDPDHSFSPSSNEEIIWTDKNARAFGFLNLSKKNTIQDFGEGSDIGTIEGFGPEWEDVLYISEPGDSHLSLFRQLLPKIWNSSQGVIKIMPSTIDPSTGIKTTNANENPIVLDLRAFSKKDKKLLYSTVEDFFRYINVRVLMFPAGRIWQDHKVISFWTNEGEVTQQHLDRVFTELKIPKEEMENYHLEFLGDDGPQQTISQYVSKSSGKQPVLSKKEQEEKDKRKKEALAKVHIAGAQGTKDREVQDLVAKRKEDLVQADAAARASGKIPDIKTKQQAMTSESKKTVELLNNLYEEILSSEAFLNSNIDLKTF